MAFDVKRYSKVDRVIVGGGIVVLVSTFLPWYGVSFAGYSATVSGWNAGFIGWFGALLSVLGALYVALDRQGMSVPRLPFGAAVTVAGLAALGVLFVVWRWATLPRASALGRAFNFGPRFGIFLALIGGIIELGGAIVQFRSSGEKLPWDHSTPPA